MTFWNRVNKALPYKNLEKEYKYEKNVVSVSCTLSGIQL